MASWNSFTWGKMTGSHTKSISSNTLWPTTLKKPRNREAILLSSCGQSTYKVIRNLMAPRKPAECNYAVILENLKHYYSPKPSIIVQHCKFNTCYRQQGESIAKFEAELRRIAQFRGYEGTLEDMLHDWLVCGVNNTEKATSRN